MKKQVAGGILMAVCVGGLCTARRAEGGILSNPGFDEPKSDQVVECDEAAGWERWGAWVNRHKHGSEWRARNGRALVAYHHWESDSPTAGWSQTVTNLEAGATYRFSVWAQWDPNCNASNVELRIEPDGASRFQLVEQYTAARVGKIWTYLCVQGKMPADATAARLVIQCTHGFAGDTADASGAIKFDDAELTKLRAGKRF